MTERVSVYSIGETMSLKTALDTNPVLVFAVLLFGGWLAMKWLDVLETMQMIGELGLGQAVGQTLVSGVIGLIVMAVTVGLAVVLFAAMGEADPAPETFPPRR